MHRLIKRLFKFYKPMHYGFIISYEPLLLHRRPEIINRDRAPAVVEQCTTPSGQDTILMCIPDSKDS